MGPTMNDYLNGEAAEYFDEISTAMRVIQEYKSGERIYDRNQAEQDCIMLSATHAMISEMVGYLQGMSSRAESNRKVVKSQYALQLKQERDIIAQEGTAVRVTEAEIDHASRTLAKEFYASARDMETVSRMITSAWYAIGDFVRILNSVCQRAHKENQL